MPPAGDGAGGWDRAAPAAAAASGAPGLPGGPGVASPASHLPPTGTSGGGDGALRGHGLDSLAAGSVPGRIGSLHDAGAAAIRSLEEQEIEALRRAVELARGNISEASKRLGISRNTIYRKLRWKTTR